MSYIVSKPVTFGENRVSLPTGRVDGRGRTKARLIDFGSETDGPATLEMPDEVREALFPGSTSVKVHFSHEGRKEKA